MISGSRSLNLAKDFGKTIGSEWLLPRILPFEKAVSDEEHHISAFHRELGGEQPPSISGSIPKANLRMHVSQRLVSGRVNEKRTMTGGESNSTWSLPSRNTAATKVAKRFGRQVFRKRLVDISKDRGPNYRVH